MSIATVTVNISVSMYAEYVDVLLDPAANPADELSDLLRFDLAWINSVEWSRADGVRIVGTPGEALEEAIVGARYTLAEEGQ